MPPWSNIKIKNCIKSSATGYFPVSYKIDAIKKNIPTRKKENTSIYIFMSRVFYCQQNHQNSENGRECQEGTLLSDRGAGKAATACQNQTQKKLKVESEKTVAFAYSWGFICVAQLIAQIDDVWGKLVS